jgi:hypothetical protein
MAGLSNFAHHNPDEKVRKTTAEVSVLAITAMRK